MYTLHGFSEVAFSLVISTPNGTFVGYSMILKVDTAAYIVAWFFKRMVGQRIIGCCARVSNIHPLVLGLRLPPGPTTELTARTTDCPSDYCLIARASLQRSNMSLGVDRKLPGYRNCSFRRSTCGAYK